MYPSHVHYVIGAPNASKDTKDPLPLIIYLLALNLNLLKAKFKVEAFLGIVKVGRFVSLIEHYNNRNMVKFKSLVLII